MNVWLFSIGVALMLAGWVRGLVWDARTCDGLAMLGGFLTALKALGA